MLSDENDCSIVDENGDLGWYVSTTSDGMARATSICATNPNDECCRSCASNAPVGCPTNDQDSECQKGTYVLNTEDKIDLRCWDQKRRFGIDFLYPTQRYVNALTQKQLCKTRKDLDANLCAEIDLVPNPFSRI
jgi:hypothetical protein